MNLLEGICEGRETVIRQTKGFYGSTILPGDVAIKCPYDILFVSIIFILLLGLIISLYLLIKNNKMNKKLAIKKGL